MSTESEFQRQLSSLRDTQQQILQALQKRNTNDAKQLLSTREAANYLGMSRRKFDELVALGEIMFVKLFERGRLYNKKQLDELIRARTTRVGSRARDRNSIQRVR